LSALFSAQIQSIASCLLQWRKLTLSQPKPAHSIIIIWALNIFGYQWMVVGIIGWLCFEAMSFPLDQIRQGLVPW